MAERIPQSVARRVPLKVYLSSDHVTEATGKTVTVVISKNGAAFGNPSAGITTATEIGSGWYYVDLSTTDIGTLGPLIVRGTASACDPSEPPPFQVVDAHNAGFDALPSVASGSAGGVLVQGTGTTGVNTSAGAVPIQAGTATGQLDFTAGIVKANQTQVLGTTLTESAGGRIAGGVKKFFDVATPTGTVNSLPGAVAGATGGLVTSLWAGQLQAGSNSSATLDSGFDGDATGATLVFTGGTGLRQQANIITYDRTTKVSTFAALSIAVDNTTTFRLEPSPALNTATGFATSDDITAIESALGSIQSDTDDIQARIPTTLPPTVVQIRQEMDTNSVKLAYLSGDSFIRLGAPANGSVSADIAAINTGGVTPPTVVQIRQEMDANSAKLAYLSGDSFVRLGAPANGSIAADIAGISTGGVTPPTAAEIADGILARNLAGGSDGGRTVRSALQVARNRVRLNKITGQLEVYNETNSVIAWSAPFTTDSTAEPIVEINPP